LKPVAGAVSRYILHAAGLGKTTIAHVVARHCGYRPFEINASDDRTATALQSRIQDAVQMQSVLGKRQMNLVIVDEVDGIAGNPLQLFPAALPLLSARARRLIHHPACQQGCPAASVVHMLINATWCHMGCFKLIAHCVFFLCFFPVLV